jgi:hypothetical protein
MGAMATTMLPLPTTAAPVVTTLPATRSVAKSHRR